jgi:hypothetical protein
MKIKRTIIEGECEGEIHRIEIVDSIPRLLDHTDEQVAMVASFEAFGSEPHPASCFRLLRMWQTDPWWAALQLAPYPGCATFVECSNEECNWSSDDIDAVRLHDADNLADRLLPGEIVPAGECPECYALVYIGREIKK